jgi:hypothetical protein
VIIVKGIKQGELWRSRSLVRSPRLTVTAVDTHVAEQGQIPNKLDIASGFYFEKQNYPQHNLTSM